MLPPPGVDASTDLSRPGWAREALPVPNPAERRKPPSASPAVCTAPRPALYSALLPLLALPPLFHLPLLPQRPPSFVLCIRVQASVCGIGLVPLPNVKALFRRSALPIVSLLPTAPNCSLLHCCKLTALSRIALSLWACAQGRVRCQQLQRDTRVQQKEGIAASLPTGLAA